jgi:hypothetical protein
MGDATNNGRLGLRHLPFVPRVVIAVYLISVGIGYFSALVQLHFQHASAGQPLPELKEVQDAYGTGTGIGQLQRLITADESRPFNGSGQMRAAFFAKSGGWKREIRERAKEDKIPEAEAEKKLRTKRAVEPDAIVAWIQDGAKKDSYEDFKFVLPDSVVAGRLTDDSTFFKKTDDGKWTANIKEIIDSRCVKCHAPGQRTAAGQIHLDEYEKVMDYVTPDTSAEGKGSGSGMSLTKLAQSTHVHLLGFSMLYGLTGFIFAFTSYPSWIRFIIAPLALLAQVGEISCWWLCRADKFFANGIMALGGIVAVSLGVQIILSLLNLFDIKGKIVVLLLLVAGGGAAGVMHTKFIEPHLQQEKTTMSKGG